MEDFLTPEGEIILKALEVHCQHLESHECEQCLSSYETVLNAITEWIKFEKEGSDDKQTAEGQKEKDHASQKGEDIFDYTAHGKRDRAFSRTCEW